MKKKNGFKFRKNQTITTCHAPPLPWAFRHSSETVCQKLAVIGKRLSIIRNDSGTVRQKPIPLNTQGLIIQ